MAKDFRISCIFKTTSSNHYQRIHTVGGIDAGVKWSKTEDQAILEINLAASTFHTFENGKRANVIVVTGYLRPYLKTVADGLHPDNLLALPDCRSN